MAITDYDFDTTRNEIIQRAFRMVGALADGESLSAEMLANGVIALNDMVDAWQGDRIFLWTLQELSVTLVVATATYAISDDPLVIGVDAANLVDSSGNESPLKLISKREYHDILDKDMSGEPCSIMIDHNPTLSLTTWPVLGSGSYTINVLAITKMTDWDTAAGVGDLPRRWKEALVYNLANRLVDEYPLELSRIRRIEQMAERSYAIARKSDRDIGDVFVSGAFE